MESQLELFGVSSSSSVQPVGFTGSSPYNSQLSLDSTVISSLQISEDAAVVDLNLNSGIDIQGIVKKINQLLVEKLPQGVESLKAEDYTPDKTSDTIINGIEALFSRYIESNPELNASEAIKRFMAAARSGVESGYNSAVGSLDTAGAFQIDGIKSGVESTKSLLDQKLDALEQKLKKSYAVPEQEEISGLVASQVSTQAGVQASNLDLTA